MDLQVIKHTKVIPNFPSDIFGKYSEDIANTLESSALNQVP